MIMSGHRVQHTLSTAYTKYSIHRVQHTPSTVSTHDCMSSLHCHEYELTAECSFSLRCAPLYDRPSSASSPWGLLGKVTLSHSNGWELTNWWMESQHPVRLPSTASRYSSNLAQSQPASVSPNSLDHGLQVQFQTRSMTASKCISRLIRLRPACSHNHGLQVHISKLARLRPPGSHDRGLHQCISKVARSWPRSVSLSSLDVHFHVHIELLPDTACSQSRYTVWKSVPV